MQDQGLDASTSSEEEDEMAELITPKLDLQIIQTLQRYLFIHVLVKETAQRTNSMREVLSFSFEEYLEFTVFQDHSSGSGDLPEGLSCI